MHDEARPPAPQNAGTAWVDGGPAPRTLDAACVLITIEAVLEVIAIAWRGQLTIPMRVLLVLVVALQFALVWRVRHRSAGAVLGLMLFQLSAALVALGASDWPVIARSGLGLAAVLAIGLLAASAHAFPSPTIPRP